MTTKHPRINITPSRAMREALEQAAKRDNMTLSAKAAAVLELGLALEEDLSLVEVANARMQTNRDKYLSHDTVWQ